MFKKYLPGIILGVAALISAIGITFSVITALDANAKLSEINESASAKFDKYEDDAKKLKDEMSSDEPLQEDVDNAAIIQGELDKLEEDAGVIDSSVSELTQKLDQITAALPHISMFPHASVASFGAIGHDSVDDTVAIQQALDNKKNGGFIYFPAGKYYISKTLYFYSNQTLYFEEGATLIRNSSSCSVILANSSTKDQVTYSACTNVDIIGASFSGNSDYTTPVTFIQLAHADNIRINSCIFRFGTNTSYINILGSRTVKIHACVLDKSTATSAFSGGLVAIQAASTGIVADDSKINLDSTVCQNIEISDSTFTVSTAVPAVFISEKTHKAIKIQRNTFSGNPGNTTGVIYISNGATAVDVYSNSFSNATNAVLSKNDKKNVSVFKNRFASVTTPYSTAVVAYSNFVDNKLVANN